MAAEEAAVILNPNVAQETGNSCRQLTAKKVNAERINTRDRSFLKVIKVVLNS
jgi:hypothetical protein